MVVNMADSAQKFIKRNRPPRVQIAYQDPYDSEKMVELPFVMAVMADLSGNASDVEKPPVGERKFLDTDMDNFDARMRAVKPGLSFRVPNKLGGAEGANQKLGIKLNFEKMADFDPAAIAKQVPELAKLLEARQRLSNLQRFMDGKVAAEDQLKALLNDPDLMKIYRDRQAGGAKGSSEASTS